jgi:hypothetical protein
MFRFFILTLRMSVSVWETWKISAAIARLQETLFFVQHIVQQKPYDGALLCLGYYKEFILFFLGINTGTKIFAYPMETSCICQRYLLKISKFVPSGMMK